MARQGLEARRRRRDDAADESLGLLIRQLHLALRAAANAALAGGEHGMAHLGILEAIERTPGISSADLARRNSVTPASIAEVIADLERSRLIVREQDRAGGRALGARLTPAGADVLQQGRAALQDVEARMLQNLKPSEFSVFRDLLRRCIASLQATPRQAAFRGSEG